jgi:hypothetical protein
MAFLFWLFSGPLIAGVLWTHADRFDDSLPDVFRDWREHCVPECFKAVCPIGNPIHHSSHSGFMFKPDVSLPPFRSINHAT